MPRIPLSQFLHLSPTERIQLAQDLWDSVAANPEQVETTPEQLAELESRLMELDENPEAGEPWNQVKASTLKFL